MPDCLKGGMIGFEMLQMASRDDFYGTVAREVSEICAERNETFYKQWICLENAARKAVEIRGMIGAEQMIDRCYRALSDPSVHERLTAESSALRRRVVGEGYWSGVSSYYAFEGCDDVVPPEPKPDDATFSAAACLAYGEVETVLRNRSAEELRQTFRALERQPEGARLALLAQHGVSQATVETLSAEMEGESALGGAMLLMGLLRESQPGIFAEIVDRGEETNMPMADQMATGMFDLILGGVISKFREACPPT